MPRNPLPFGSDDAPIADQLQRRILHSIQQHLPQDSPAATQHATQQRIDQEGFREFAEQAWHLVEAVPFVGNWHIDSVADHFFACLNGDIPPWLLLNVPPGTGKSLLTTVLIPAYVWGPGGAPWMRFLVITYSNSLAKRDALKFRTIVESKWYRERWPNARARTDQATKELIESISSGQRISATVGGSVTGWHPDVILLDDCLRASDANSENARHTTNLWLGDTLSTRGLTRQVKFVMATQRLAPDDPSDWFLRSFPGCTHLCLPMEYDPAHPVRDPKEPTPIGFVDPRTEPGELLWPDLIDREKVERVKTSLVHAHKSAAQLQQAPTAASGELIMRSWFQIIDAMPPDDIVVASARGWDLASTESAGDFTAGVLISKLKSGKFIVLHATRGQWGPGNRDGHIRRTAERDGPEVRIALERAGNAGREQVAGIARSLAGFKLQGIPVGRSGKLERADGLISQLQTGNLFLIRGPWNSAFIDEMCSFPSGIHDDQVDAASLAFNHLLKACRGFVCFVGNTGKKFDPIPDRMPFGMNRLR